MRPEKSDYVFHRWAKKNDPKSPYYWEWIQWVDRYFDVNEVGIFMRTTPYYAPDSRVTRDSGRRKPPKPPKPTKCQGCKDFTKQGSTGYTIRKTCLDCGHLLQFGRADLCHAETLKPQRDCVAIRLRRTSTFTC